MAKLLHCVASCVRGLAGEQDTKAAAASEAGLRERLEQAFNTRAAG